MSAGAAFTWRWKSLLHSHSHDCWLDRPLPHYMGSSQATQVPTSYLPTGHKCKLIFLCYLYASLKEFDKVKCGTITALSNMSFFHCCIYVYPAKYRNSIKRFFPHVKTFSSHTCCMSSEGICPHTLSVSITIWQTVGLMQFKCLFCFNLLLHQVATNVSLTTINRKWVFPACTSLNHIFFHCY